MKTDLLNLDAALRVDPFAGDFGCPGDKTFKDKIIKVRKEGPCHHCAEAIKKGSLARSRTELFDGTIETYRWCQPCTELMARYHDDDFEDEWEKRGRINRAIAPAQAGSASPPALGSR